MRDFSAGTIALIVVAAVLLVIAATLFNGFIWMLLLGVLWGEFQIGAPIGLLPAWGLATLVGVVFAGLGTSWNSSSNNK